MLKITTNKRCISFPTKDIKLRNRGGFGINLATKLNFSKDEYIVKINYEEEYIDEYFRYDF